MKKSTKRRLAKEADRRKKAPVNADKMVDRAVQLATGDGATNLKVGNLVDRDAALVKAGELSEDTNKFLRERVGILSGEFYERVTAKMENLVDMLADDLAERHKDMPPQNLAYALGIALDKVNLLKGRPQAVTANVNMGFGPKQRSREEILSILSGEQDVEEKVVEVK